MGKTKYSIYNAHGINDSIYICSGAFFPNRYIIYNSNQKSYKPWGEYPYQKKLKIPKMSFGMVFQSEFLNLQDNYFVSSVSLSPSIAFYNLNKGDIRLLKEWNYEIPQVIGHNEAGMSWVDKKASNKMGFCSLASDKNKVFALYSGRTYNDKKDEMYYGSTIMVYSKRGNLIAKLKLNTDLMRICVMGDKIIGIIDYPEMKLFSFLIPNDLEK